MRNPPSESLGSSNLGSTSRNTTSESLESLILGSTLQNITNIKTLGVTCSPTVEFLNAAKIAIKFLENRNNCGDKNLINSILGKIDDLRISCKDLCIIQLHSQHSRDVLTPSNTFNTKVTIRNTEGTIIEQFNVIPGTQYNIEISDSTAILKTAGGDVIMSRDLPATTNGVLYAPNVLVVVKDSSGNILETLEIPSGGYEEIIFPDCPGVDDFDDNDFNPQDFG